MSTGHRPEFVVFYAWQSDRPGNQNRYLIQEAANKAAEQLNSDSSFSYTVRIDQDTQDEPGLCDIPATILKKIDSADAFLCDLSYVAATQPETEPDDKFEKRLCSNPNVLFELGYAFRAIGDKRILCVMNEHCGPIEQQIFDLAHRRFPIAYKFPNKPKTRNQVISELATNLVSALRPILALGKISANQNTNGTPQLYQQMVSEVKQGIFHELYVKGGTLVVAVMPSQSFTCEYEQLRKQQLRPLCLSNGCIECRGNSILARAEYENLIYAVTELRGDGIIYGANSLLFDPELNKHQPYSFSADKFEIGIIISLFEYFSALKALRVPLPWTVYVSLLNVGNYFLYMAPDDSWKKRRPEPDINPNPVIVKELSAVGTKEKVASHVRHIIDFIWREFGVDGSPNYTDDGTYTNRAILLI